VELTEAWVQEVIDQEIENVTHELCARISAAVGRALDEVEAFEGAYTLEVSSPGIERPLRKRSHFEAQVGKKIYVKTRVPVEGSKVWQGVLLEVGETELVVQDAGREVRVPLGEIGSAHLIYEFG
jgi:ribosome maturation factor RimP